MKTGFVCEGKHANLTVKRRTRAEMKLTVTIREQMLTVVVKKRIRKVTHIDCARICQLSFKES